MRVPIGDRLGARLFAAAALLGEQASGKDDRPDSLRFLRFARRGDPHAADPAAASVADRHHCGRHRQAGEQPAEVVAALRRAVPPVLGPRPGRESTQPLIPGP